MATEYLVEPTEQIIPGITNADKRKSKRGFGLKERKSGGFNWIAAAFIGPHLLLFLIFFVIPAVFGLYIAFTRWNLTGAPTFVGFENFRTILFDRTSTFHEQFVRGFRNTFLFVLLTVPFCIIIPLLFAAALHAKPWGRKFFQVLFYMPALFSVSAVMLIWGQMFSRTFGPINRIFGLDRNWTGTQPWAWWALVIVTIWWTIGGNMIIYQAALAAVPQHLYEAASLDGATKLQQFWHITLPGISNQILFTLVMTTIAQFNVFGQPLMLTGGGPASSTSVLLMYIQGNAFGTGQSIAGIASAMAVMLGLAIMAVSFVQFLILRDRD